ncbi:MAG: ParA family protein [Deltaproteobacteria bacterium]|jgi:chromosome partitioning protein|nr:ParA family protein [Deltaproteobacteria bacterium]MBT4525152.1 ParA family protein [Deltaproteobacteria bacterium]
MKSVAVYNNKGGVGKSTISLFLADFFATMKLAGKLSRILVIDLDAQNSSSNALLGIKTVSEARLNKQTISHLLFKLALKEKTDPDPFLIKRLKNTTPNRKKPLCELSVMMTDRMNSLSFEKKCTKTGLKVLSKKLKSLLNEKFDFIFIDLPANIDERNKLSQLGLMLSDYILIPTEPSRIAINSLPDTLKNIQSISQLSQKNFQEPGLIGLLLNKTDKRTKQYKLHNKDLSEFAASNEISIFKNFLPHSSTLCSASDDSISFGSLKDRYDNNYEHVRKVSMELAGKIGFQVSKK